MKKLKDATKIKALGITVKPKNRFYWFESVQGEIGWLSPQRNRRFLVSLMIVGLIAVAMGSYWPTLKTGSLILNSVTAIFAIFAVLGGYVLLRISVRSIADAPDELLDERQIKVRNTSIRYSYYAMGFVVLGLLSLMFFGPDLKMFQTEGNDGSYPMIATLFAYASMPSMVIAWRERDI